MSQNANGTQTSNYQVVAIDQNGSSMNPHGEDQRWQAVAWARKLLTKFGAREVEIQMYSKAHNQYVRDDVAMGQLETRFQAKETKALDLESIEVVNTAAQKFIGVNKDSKKGSVNPNDANELTMLVFKAFGALGVPDDIVRQAYQENYGRRRQHQEAAAQ